MNFITDLLIAGLVTYMSFTSNLANHILALLPTAKTQSTFVEKTSSPLPIAELPSSFNKEAIPNILRQSVAFQQAALGDALPENTYTQNPLEALVNIFCTFTTKDYIRTTTGTGFFVHSNGVIITNAHVAQFLLLGESDLLGKADCTIRHGNPASIAYKAKLLYIPPAWVKQNASIIDAEVPTGTGERDYALLYVTESLTGEPLPVYFPALAVDTEPLPVSIKESTVKAAGYPATDLLKNGASTPLLPRLATTTISELYTFGSNYADVFAIRGSVVGAEGSSGGPVVNDANKVIGMIVTRGDDETDGAGSLRAISLSHIERTIQEETGFSFERNISGNLPRRSSVFMTTLAPFLLSLLSVELSN